MTGVPPAIWKHVSPGTPHLQVCIVPVSHRLLHRERTPRPYPSRKDRRNLTITSKMPQNATECHTFRYFFFVIVTLPASDPSPQKQQLGPSAT